MNRGLILSLCMLGGGTVLADPVNSADKDTNTPTKADVTAPSSKLPKTSKMDKQVKLPSDVKLVATSEIAEVRSFPELNKNKEATTTEDTIGAGAIDNVYETQKPYREAVRFYDGMIKDGVATKLSRTVTKTSTAWEFRLNGGERQNVIVRNTRPTTIETVQAAAALERDTIKNDLGKDAPSMQDTDK
jgi:hypothetical protein